MLKQVKHLYNSAVTHQGFRRYFANTSWMFAEQILRMIAGLLVGIWVARYLGPEQFGVFSYVIAFAAIFGSIAKLGLDGIVVRDLVRDPTQRDLLLGTAFWLKLIGAVAMLAIIAVAVQFTSNDRTTNIFIFIIASGAIFQAFEVVDFYFQSKVLSKFVSVCKLTQLFISSLLKIYFVLTEADLVYFVIVGLIDQAMLAVTLILAYRYQKLGWFHKYFDWVVGKRLLINSWPLLVTGLVLMIQARIDQVMLKEMVGSTEVGYYSSALRLIEVFGFIPMILVTSLFPAIVNAKEISIDIYKSRLMYLYKLMMVMFLMVAVPIYFMGDTVIVMLFGAEYLPAGELLSLMAIRLLFTNYGVVRGAYLMTENLVKYSTITMIIGMLVNVGLNYIWIPSYHSVGAIYASFVSFFVTIFLIDLFYSKTKWNCILMIRSIFLIDIKGK